MPPPQIPYTEYRLAQTLLRTEYKGFLTEVILDILICRCLGNVGLDIS